MQGIELPQGRELPRLRVRSFCYVGAVPRSKPTVKTKAKAKLVVKPPPTPAKVEARAGSRRLTVKPRTPVATTVKFTKPTLPVAPPAPPPPPPPPPPRDELPAPRDVARLLRYGERFGTNRIDVRMLPLQLPVSSGALAIVDPAVPKTWRVFDRPTGSGQFRVMLSVAKTDKDVERLAAIVIHVGRPPIARWTVAHYKGQKKPKSADALPRTAATGWLALVDAGTAAPGVIAVPPPSGVQPVEVTLADGRRALALPCGMGEFAAYWAVDAADKPICLVVDFDVFTQKEWKAKPAP